MKNEDRGARKEIIIQGGVWKWERLRGEGGVIAWGRVSTEGGKGSILDIITWKNNNNSEIRIRIFAICYYRDPALISFDSMYVMRSSPGGQACAHNQHTEKHKSWQRHLDTLKHSLTTVGSNARGPGWNWVPPPAALFSLECCFYFLVWNCVPSPTDTQSHTQTHPLEHFTRPFSTNTFEKTASDRCPKQKQSWEAKNNIYIKILSLAKIVSVFLSLCARKIYCVFEHESPPTEVNVLLHLKKKKKQVWLLEGKLILVQNGMRRLVSIPFTGATVS